ncbi:hypothetical protein BCR41DRAFT_374244 [Lobosporangium transversale]|uniref:Translation initiation factor eIF 4e-like domain-containing protein n=1 Tax=Lobosporangium transversale TaxID=64571 RepID=A0A1Y2GAX5_9FUNG|nr:hypothetical protein BCR41DRAFT_374244 [Lobosporangium transversale]ORZ05905.1 hypothetical protein BCR41DRAFT_374244 [Lobosporangium transversale]|eukprot:XP_021877286.1 hypothetical protein BCR41DRAFT_374244 [Lobosporangium transversale]
MSDSNTISRDPLPTPAPASTRPPASTGPWRSASVAGRSSSPAPGQPSSFRDQFDHPQSHSHSGMTPLRANSSGAFSTDRHTRAQPNNLSSNQSGIWASPTKRATLTSGTSVSSAAAIPTSDRHNGSSSDFQYQASSASPVLGAFSSFSRSSSASVSGSSSSSSPFYNSTASAVPTIMTEHSLGARTLSTPSLTTPQKQPLNMEDLAKFAFSKETKEQFATLQLTPALTPTTLADKERRTPMGSFVAPNIKVQRTASLNQNAHSSLLPKGLYTTIAQQGMPDKAPPFIVELFARYFNWIEKPHKMENSANYHLFKDGIKPMWEDPANANGGRWIVTLLNKNAELLDRCWMEMAYALVGEQLDAGDDICGAVLSRRIKADRLAVWVRDKENVEAINGIGKRLIQILDLAKERITLEFQITTDTRSSGPPKNYITLDAIRKALAQEAPQTALAASEPHSSSGVDSTPSLSVDSVSATPASIATPSPITPTSGNPEGENSKSGVNNKESSSTLHTTGLLISVEGENTMF